MMMNDGNFLDFLLIYPEGLKNTKECGCALYDVKEVAASATFSHAVICNKLWRQSGAAAQRIVQERLYFHSSF